MLAAHVDLLLNGAAPQGQTWIFWPGGQGVLTANGTFGGATMTLTYKNPDGSTQAAGGNTTLLAPGNGVFYLGPCMIQAAVTGGSPSGLNAWADRVPQ
jgi:hypothetical protein